MTTVKFKGSDVNTIGSLPSVGSQAPEFKLTKSDLGEISLADLKGKKVILNIFPSIDTPVCAASTKKFNTEANNLDNTTILCVSMDLPFASGRFCGAEGLKNVTCASDFKNHEFGKNYGVTIKDSVLSGLFSRAIVILDETGKVIYTEQVPEITQEPNYEAALKAIKTPATA